jgi:SAM-dependent methyltransferase
MRPYTATAAKYYEFLVPFEFKRAADEVKFILSRTGKRRARVLDAACGVGRLTIPFHDAGCDVAGIDITGEMLAVAKKRAGGRRIRFINADMRRYVSPEKFDIVICGSNTMPHMMTERDAVSCFEAFRDNLKPGGFLVFDVWDYSFLKKFYLFNRTIKKKGFTLSFSETGRLYLKKRLFCWKHTVKVVEKGKKTAFTFGGKLRFRTKKEWTGLLRKAGFIDVKTVKARKLGGKLYFFALGP